MSFADFFGRLSRLSGVPAPRLRLPSATTVAAAHLLERFHAWRESEPPVSRYEAEMAERFWYIDSAKARFELGFEPRDPQETIFETWRFVEERFRGRAERQVAPLGAR
jgi:dihydroflavonol-4-reductase